MVRSIASKTAHTAVVLLVVSGVTAFMLDLAPGDPAYAVVGDSATPDQVANVREELGLDRPLLSRYADWLGDLAAGDFGTSYRTKQSVTDTILNRLPVSLELALLALALALLVAVPLGVYTAYRADGHVDRGTTAVTSVLISFPPFISAPLLVYVLVLQLHWFPAVGWTRLSADVGDNLWHAFVPALALALVEIPQLTRVLRADMIATLQEDFILAARAKGLRVPTILFRHALRPSSLSLLTLAGIVLGRLVGGTIIVEVLFVLPGLGAELITAVLQKDVIVVQGIVVFIAIGYVVLNVAIEGLYRLLDPRVRSA